MTRTAKRDVLISRGRGTIKVTKGEDFDFTPEEAASLDGQGALQPEAPREFVYQAPPPDDE